MEYEINTPKIENIETIESPIVIDKIKGINQAHSFRGWVQGRINVFSNRNNREVELVLREVLSVYEKFHSEELKDIENLKLEIEIIGKVKGVGTIEIYKGFDNHINIKIPIKDKESGIVKWTIRELKKEDLNRMIHIVKNLPINEPVSCYKMAEKLGYEWKIIWKERGKLYFPIYYFPLKFLEASKMIRYDGRGNITRLI